MIRLAFAFAVSAFLAGCATHAGFSKGERARAEVTATEITFAKTMADRDLKGFTSHLAHDTVFFSGPKPLHGPQAVTDFWARFYAQPAPPFSWKPDQVEVLEGGTLALSTGPVHNMQGKLINRFVSIWRQESPGVWKIIFDRGEPVCDCEKK